MEDGVVQNPHQPLQALINTHKYTPAVLDASDQPNTDFFLQMFVEQNLKIDKPNI